MDHFPTVIESVQLQEEDLRLKLNEANGEEFRSLSQTPHINDITYSADNFPKNWLQYKKKKDKRKIKDPT